MTDVPRRQHRGHHVHHLQETHVKYTNTNGEAGGWGAVGRVAVRVTTAPVPGTNTVCTVLERHLGSQQYCY